MNTHEKVNDNVTRVLEYYKLREPADFDTIMYLKKKETVIYKNILKKAGKYTLWLGMVYTFMKLLPKIGIQATFNKAVAALFTTFILGASGTALGLYKAVPAVMHLLQPEKTQVEEVHTPKQTADRDADTAAKPAAVTHVVSPQKTDRPALLPTIGISKLESYVPGINHTRLTKRFVSLLPKNKFQLLRSVKKDNSHLDYFSRIMLLSTKTGYEFTVQVLDENRKYRYGNTYTFKQLSELDTVLKQAAKELIDANI